MIEEVRMVDVETSFIMTMDDYRYLNDYYEVLRAQGKKLGLPLYSCSFNSYLEWLLFENREEIMTVFKKFIESESE